jgi:hypothetical protein
MSPRIIPLATTAEVDILLGDLAAMVAAGTVRAVAVVLADADGGLDTWWGASQQLGPHAGSVLRGAVAYLGARMDAAALAPDDAPIAFGTGETWTP